MFQLGGATAGNRNGRIVIKTASFTVTEDDSGTLFIIDGTDVVVTLPPTAPGINFAFIVRTLSTVTGFAVSPQAADQIAGKGITPADNKDIINTAATDAVGDLIAVVADATDGWWITNLLGTWAREA